MIPIAFQWDDAKAERNLVKHRVAFEKAIAVFADPRAVISDTTREVDGESRLKAIGLIEGRMFTVVFTRRGGMTRVISARRSNPREERLYGDRPQNT